MTKIEFPAGQGPKLELSKLGDPCETGDKNLEELGPPDLTLLATDFLKGVALVMADGAKRPGRTRHGWKDLTFAQALERLASGYRHTMNIHDGLFYDEDSGLQNAYHIAANAMIMGWHIAKRRASLDQFDV